MEQGKNLILSRAKQATLARDFETAARLYKELLRSEPDNLELLDALAELYIKNNNDTKALPIMQHIVSLAPKSIKALNTLGSVYRRLKRYEESIDTLSRALVLDNENSQIYYNLGFTYKLMDKYDDAIECLETVITKNPSDVLAYNHLGRIHEAKKEYEKALECYKRGLKVDSNHPIIHLNIAKVYEALGRDSEALLEYEAALRAKPGWIEAMDAFSSLLMKSNRTKEAGTIIQQALRLDNKSAKMYSKLGDAYFAQSDYEGAKTEYDNALEIEHEYVPALSGLTDSYERMDMLDEACNTVAVLERVRPDDDNIACKAAHVYIAAGKPQEASRKIKQVYAKNKNDPKVLDIMGQYYISTGEYKKAAACRDRINATGSSYNDHYLSWGKLYEKQGQNEAASDCYTQAVSKSKNKGEAYSNLARMYEATGNQASALECYAKAAQIDKDNILYPKFKAQIETQIANSAPKLQEEETIEPQGTSSTPVESEEDFIADDFGKTSENPIDSDDILAKDFDKKDEVPPTTNNDNDFALDLSSLNNIAPEINEEDIDSFLDELPPDSVNASPEEQLEAMGEDDDMPIEDSFSPEELKAAKDYDDILVTNDAPPTQAPPVSPTVMQAPPVQYMPPPMQYVPQYIAQPVPAVAPQAPLHTLPELLENLRSLCGYLPETRKQVFKDSNARSLLDFVISKLEGKGGLLSRASIRRQVLGIDPNAKPSSENIDAINYILSDVKDITGGIDDPNLTQSIGSVMSSIKDKIS